jgi:hypothetical protein
MGTVMSIEFARQRPGFTAHQHVAAKDTKTSRLVAVHLPLSPGEAPVRVLALMVNRSETSVRLVYSDHEHATYFRTYLGAEIPPELQPEVMDSIEGFLARHEGLCEEAAMLGSSQHGPLTLARAVDYCVRTSAPMNQGMLYAREVSLDCGQYCHRIAQALRASSPRA